MLQREHCENTGDNTERRQERPSEITLKKTLERTTHVGVHPRPLNVLTPCFLYVQPCFCREKYCRYIWVTSKRVIHNMCYWATEIYHLSTGSGKLPHGSHFCPLLSSRISACHLSVRGYCKKGSEKFSNFFSIKTIAFNKQGNF